MRLRRHVPVLFAALLVMAAPALLLAAPKKKKAPKPAAKTSGPQSAELRMSPMGALAHRGMKRNDDPDTKEVPGSSWVLLPGSPDTPRSSGGADIVVHSTPAFSLQSESSIASNAAGTVLLAGYNDGRGFNMTAANGFSLSGIARSTDGGASWQDGPLYTSGTISLPVMPSVPNGQIYGDPDIKWTPFGGPSGTWVYSSIYVRPGDSLQGMCVNVSTDDGAIWTAPRQVTPTFVTGNAADKEFIAINPATGRLVMTWTNFPTSGTVSIRSSYSDDFGITWSPAVTLGSGTYQSAIPRWLPGTTNANSTLFVAWRSSPAATTRNIMMTRSLDGGSTFSAAVKIDSADYPQEDQVPGVDRVNNSPSLDVDATTGRVYVVYQRNNSVGTGDIALRTFVGTPAAGAPVLLDADPGNDRAQIDPWVAVDQSNGRVHVMWLDQGYGSSGDLIEAMHTWSDDQGSTWSPPAPLSDRPYHAGWGNDTSEPNLGDYNECVAGLGVLHSTWGGTASSVRFDEGQPSASMNTPDTYYDRTVDSARVAAIRPGAFTALEGCTAGTLNGYLDPTEVFALTVPLRNYLGSGRTFTTTWQNVSGTLTTSTPGVTVLNPTVAWADLPPGGSASGLDPFHVSLSAAFVPGTTIDFRLAVAAKSSANGQAYSADLPFQVGTGTPGTATTLLSEDFTATTITASQTPPTTTAWYSVRGGTTVSTAPAWAVNQILTPGNNAAYHSETALSQWVRLWSPYFTIPTPAGISVVTLDFDTVYNLENEPTQSVLAYDGLTVRFTDQTAGQTVRSVLAEAFADSILTGSTNHLPKHLPRSNATNYFPDVAVWSGNSGGSVHVAMRFPGAGMTGRTAQLRYEYTSDSTGICASGTCGVAIDNIVLKLVPMVSSPCTPLPLAPSGIRSTGSCGAVSLAWDDDGTATSWTVRRGASCGTLVDLAVVPVGSGPSYQDSTAAAGTPYVYAVVASNANGTGAASRCVTVTPTAPPTTMASPLVVTKSGSAALLGWPASAGATQYRVHAAASPSASPWPDPNPANTVPAGWGLAATTSGTSVPLAGALSSGADAYYHVSPGDGSDCFNYNQPLGN